ncbi:MAG: hypothetical protein HY721_15785 [Planctomycetes bacterium]|nr:hypothetical protein [Planctomycetota bacterium]
MSTRHLPSLVRPLFTAIVAAFLASPSSSGFAAAAPAPLLAAPCVLGQAGGAPAKRKVTPQPTKSSKGEAPSADPKADKAASAAATTANPAPAARAGSFVDSLVAFIKDYAVWILAFLATCLTAILAWAYLGSRKGTKGTKGGESPFAELGLGEKTTAKPAPAQRYSSTKIQAADVNDRLSRTVKTTEVETDREYALVVDEEALKMPPVPEDPAVSRALDPASVRRLLDERNFAAAYDEYLRQIEAHAGTAYQGDLELALGEQLLRERHLEKAARVLEHHVATRSRTEVRPETYFNLGYIHFMQRTLTKSRRFLHIFCEVEKNPAYIERARKILAKMKTRPSKN